MLSSGSEFASLCAQLVKDEEFSSKPTNGSKIEHIFTNVKPLQQFREEITKMANNYRESHGKSLKRAQTFRADADNFMVIKDYHQAIKMYTYALVSAPFPVENDEHKELQKCYTSRAKAFFEKGEFSDALYDTEKSIFLGRTNEMLFQKAFCLRSLGRYGEAKRLIDGCIQSCGWYKLDEEPELLAKFKDMKESVDTQFATFGEGPNPLLKEEPPNYDFWFDRRLEVSVTQDKGRHIVAKEAVPKDSIIVAERLEHMVLSPEYMLSHCSNCLKYVGSQFWPCIWCNEVVFCDRQCHDRGLSDFHYYECQIAGMIAISPFYQAFRAVTRVNAEYAFNTATKEDREPFDVNKWMATFYGRDIEPVYRRVREERVHHFEAFLSLVDHNDECTVEEDAKHSLLAIETALLIENKEAFKTDDDKRFAEFVGFLVKMFRKTMANSFSWTFRTPNGLQSVGSCTLIYSSLINHSCWPNSYWVFFNDKIVFRSLNEIKAGEELTTTYGPGANMPLHQRQTILRNHYHFVCKCHLCKVQVNLYPALKCFECNGPVLFLPEVKAPLNDVCLDCGAKYENIRQMLFNVSLLRLRFDESIKKAESLMGKDTSPKREQQPNQFDDMEDEDEEQSEDEAEEHSKESQEEVKAESEEDVKDESESESQEEEVEPQNDAATDAEPEADVETESQKEAKRKEIDSCLKSADKYLKEIIVLHYENCDEIFDLENQLSRLYVENNDFSSAVPHFQRILASIDWSKCGQSCRHWETLAFITKAFYDHLKDENVSKKSEWKQCFKSFGALKQSYKTLKTTDKSQQWVTSLTIDGKPVQSADDIKEFIREKKANFNALKDVYKKLFSV